MIARHPLLIALALVLGLPAAAPATLHSGYDFPGGSLAASFGEFGVPQPPPLEGQGTSTGAFEAGDGYLASLAGVFSPDAWTVIVSLELDAVGGEQRILDLTGGLAVDGLWLNEGVLEWRSGRATQSGGRPLEAGEPAHLVVVRDQDGLRVYRDGSVALTVDTPGGAVMDPFAGLRLFGADGPPGRLRRLRVLDHALTPAQILALRELDAEAPTEVSVLPGSWGTYVDGSEFWVGPLGAFAVTGRDDGTGPLDLDAAIFDERATAQLGGPLTATSSASGHQVEEIVSAIDVPFDARALADGGSYRLRGTLTDRVGRSAAFDRPFRADLSPPVGLTVATPPDSVVSVPVFEGAAATGSRDAPSVAVLVCHGTTCDATEGDEVGFAGTAVDGGRWRISDLVAWRDGVRDPVDVDELAPGTYVVQASQPDFVGNVAIAETTFRVVGRPRPEPSRPRSPVPAPPVAPPVLTPPGPQLLSPAALLARNRSSVIASLRRERLRGLLKDGRAAVDVFTDRPAQIVVELRDVSTRRLLATGRRSFSATGPGRLAVRLSRRGRALLKGRRSRRVRVQTTIAPRGAPPVSAAQRLTLRR